MEAKEFRSVTRSEHLLQGGLNVDPGSNWEFATRSDQAMELLLPKMALQRDFRKRQSDFLRFLHKPAHQFRSVFPVFNVN